MSEELVIRHCSPTLAGLKTGSLFNCPYGTERELTDGVRQLNRRLGPSGLRVVPVRRQAGRALIYVYRPARLRQDLAQPMAQRLLAERGYPCGQPECCVARLMQRLRQAAEFPHEIGLFLGYPPEDVQGFLENRPCKCVGCWKVYGDEQASQKRFRQFHKCTEVYRQQWNQGRPIEKLAVKYRS